MIAKKFTLIELMVVVAMIGILTSMLLPALAKVRDKGKQAVCTNNLKQLNLGTALYVNDYDGAIMPSAGITGYNWRYGFDNILGTWGRDDFFDPYFDQNYSVAQCPGVSYERGSYYNGVGNSGDYVYWGNSQWSGIGKADGYAFATNKLFEPEDITWGDIWTMPFGGNDDLWRNHALGGLFLYYAGNVKFSYASSLGVPLLYGEVRLPKSVYP